MNRSNSNERNDINVRRDFASVQGNGKAQGVRAQFWRLFERYWGNAGSVVYVLGGT